MRLALANRRTSVTGAGDIDFLIGSWEIASLRLLRPLGCFAAGMIPVHVGNGPGFSGLTRRLFNPEREEGRFTGLAAETAS